MLSSIFKTNRCKICKANRKRRFCPRTGKEICWECCLNLKMDQKCPSECDYRLKKKKGQKQLINFETKVDSMTENIELTKRLIDRWFVKPLKIFNEKTPMQMLKSKEEKEKLLELTNSFKLPQNFPVDYLFAKLNMKKNQEYYSHETVAKAYIEKLIAQEWEASLDYLVRKDVYQDEKIKSSYLERLQSHKIVKRMNDLNIIASAISENKNEALVLFEINQKFLLLINLILDEKQWLVKQNIFGDFEDFYNVKKAIHLIAVQLSQQKLGNVYDDLKKFSDIYPDNADIAYYWGMYYSMSGNNEKAKKYFLQAYELDQNFEQTIYNLGFIEQAEKNNEIAKKWYDKVLEINPDEYKSLNNLSVIFEEEENYEKAYEMINKCLKAKPDFEPAQKNHERLKNIVEEN